MSVSIQNTLSLFQPVYNTSYSRVLGSNVAQPNYQYIFDLYLSGVSSASTTIYTGRYPINARPDTFCNFSPNRILESYFSYDLVHNLKGTAISTGCCRQYFLYMGEQYGSPTITAYSGLTLLTGYTLNAVSQYTDLPDWNYNSSWRTYYMTGTSSQFLTNMPDRVYIRPNERASISFLNYSNHKINHSFTGTPSGIAVQAYRTSGGSSSVIILNRGDFSAKTTNANALINHFGCGIWNLNNIDPADIYSGSLPIINTDTDYQYTVQLFYNTLTGSNISLSKPQTFVIDTTYTRYPTIRFMFLNRLGQFDYFTSKLMSRTFNDIKRTTYQKVLGYNYKVGDRGRAVSDLDVQTRIQVTSDWVTNQESSWLQELFQSKEVYELQSDGTILPVIIDNNSVEDKRSINDKLINYTFEYSYAFKTNTLRG